MSIHPGWFVMVGHIMYTRKIVYYCLKPWRGDPGMRSSLYSVLVPIEAFSRQATSRNSRELYSPQPQQLISKSLSHVVWHVVHTVAQLVYDWNYRGNHRNCFFLFCLFPSGDKMSLDLISSLDTRFFAEEISSQHISFGKFGHRCFSFLWLGTFSLTFF